MTRRWKGKHMGLLDTAKSTLDNGFEMAAGTVGKAVRAAGDLGIEHSSYMQSLAALCQCGFEQGWHEANGGNVSYRLNKEEVEASKAAFCKDAPWVELETPCEQMGGQFFAVTATGCHLRRVPDTLPANCGIVEIGRSGSSWRTVWGFAKGGKPTSELASHLLIHAVRARVTGGAARVLYHAHPANVIALTMITKPSAKKLTRVLWKSLTECIMLTGQGVGYVPWMVPGSDQIAYATAQQMETHNAVIWAHHGLFSSGNSFDEVFGLAHTIDKAAGIYLTARAANGGSDKFASSISDAQLIEMCDTLHIDCKREWLDA